MPNLYTTFDHTVSQKRIRTLYGGVYAMLAKEFGAKLLSPDFFKHVQARNFEDSLDPVAELADADFVFHSGMDLQMQVFDQGVLPLNLFADQEDFDMDQYSFRRSGTSDIEQRTNRYLFAHIPDKTHCLYVPQDFKCTDITDKMSAVQLFDVLKVPSPHSLPLSTVLKSSPYRFAKHRRGSKSLQVHYFDEDTNPFGEFGIDNRDWLVQAEVPCPTNFPSFLRVNFDFGAITAVAIEYDPTFGKVPDLANVDILPLTLHGFETNHKLTDLEKHILNSYGISEEKREIPEEVMRYANSVMGWCNGIGIQCAGIDFLKDKETGDWNCVDVNRSPGAMIYYVLERTRDVNPLFRQPYRRDEDFTPLRRAAIHQYVREPFAKLIGAD
ncbi:hypothetical protein HN419_00830 [Candidatus Woesearchaeota archaeon]|jgi:hypothetical protein|nr:hypothetical protein [Candidatus Woesearchaeota archaeon]MBT3537458.1 hypothetical protein [Candidatus Woesearchaeota archaeon]MBT4696944.1 hypothetical protein [Candidatus Woesearchaeota archaeon]MBT4717572.1 hypothetical protein [Candidatus Woesearchaeota archaeon]MBT7106232.1 hypothetical protein [Candidatus Woesearchaeota archaeon]